jgi:lysophospholipid acyltransferase (LPLAT)-like uncharacterized protein
MSPTSSPPLRRSSGVRPIFTRRGLRRRLLHHPWLRLAVCWGIHCYIRLIYRTNRWTVEGAESAHRRLAEGEALIGAFWHGRMLMIPMAWQRAAPVHILISAHRDGRIIAEAISYFGVGAIAGSTRRGGVAALRNILKKLKEGDCVAVTPDGPRGPAMVAGIGIVNAARLAQAPIVPLTYATSRRRILSTWDRFHVPLPFGRGVFLWGEPIKIGADLDAAGLERMRRLVEARMIDMVREADRRVGHAEAGAAAQTCAGSPQASATARVPAASGEPAEGRGEALSADRSAFLDRLG